MSGRQQWSPGGGGHGRGVRRFGWVQIKLSSGELTCLEIGFRAGVLEGQALCGGRFWMFSAASRRLSLIHTPPNARCLCSSDGSFRLFSVAYFLCPSSSNPPVPLCVPHQSSFNQPPHELAGLFHTMTLSSSCWQVSAEEGDSRRCESADRTTLFQNIPARSVSRVGCAGSRTSRLQRLAVLSGRREL